MSTQSVEKIGRDYDNAGRIHRQKSAFQLCFSHLLTVERSCVQFALNLHLAHKMPLSKAYELAVAQFRTLRAEAQVAKSVSVREAQWYGAEFAPNSIDRGFDRETQKLQTWDHRAELDSGALAARKRWKMIIESAESADWTRGQGYTRLWQEGVVPDYLPQYSSKAIDPAERAVASPTKSSASTSKRN